MKGEGVSRGINRVKFGAKLRANPESSNGVGDFTDLPTITECNLITYGRIGGGREPEWSEYKIPIWFR